MKILFLANRIPYPPYRGDKLKIFNLAKRLTGKHELHLITFAQSKDEFKYRAELEKVFNEVTLIYLPKWRSALNCLPGLLTNKPFQVLYFQSSELQNKLNDILARHQFDAVHVQHLRMSPYLANRNDIPRILDLPDAFSLYWERRRTVPRGLLTKMFENMEQRRVFKYEGILKKYNLSLACSQEDIEYLENQHHSHNLRLLPNGVDLKTFFPRDHNYTHHNTILFTGNMDYAPNIDSVIYFANEIFPLIKSQLPEVEFIIAGQRPVKKVLDLANDSIKVTGFVKDLAAMYNTASVVVAPLRFGAGTQNKVLEAMAMGVPVVCSNIGFKGLGIKSGEGAIMQISPKDFAGSVIELLRSQQLRENVGKKGIEIVKQHFDWDAIASLLEAYFFEITNK